MISKAQLLEIPATYEFARKWFKNGCSYSNRQMVSETPDFSHGFTEKLTPRDYVPFEVLQQVRKVFYKILLPPDSKVDHLPHLLIQESNWESTCLTFLIRQLTADLVSDVEPVATLGVRPSSSDSTSCAAAEGSTYPHFKPTCEGCSSAQPSTPCSLLSTLRIRWQFRWQETEGKKWISCFVHLCSQRGKGKDGDKQGIWRVITSS